MNSNFTASKTSTRTGDLQCSGRGHKVGDDWGYAVFWIVDTACNLEEEAVSSLLEFCEEGERGDIITITPCRGPVFTIEHNGDEDQLYLEFERVNSEIYQVWPNDLAQVAKEMRTQVQMVTREAKNKRPFRPGHPHEGEFLRRSSESEIEQHDDLSDPGGPGWPAIPVDHDVD